MLAVDSQQSYNVLLVLNLVFMEASSVLRYVHSLTRDTFLVFRILKVKPLCHTYVPKRKYTEVFKDNLNIMRNSEEV